MNKKYLIPIKNGFLVYQPESDTVYRGKRKTAELKHILIIPFLTAIVTPVFDFVASYIWPFLDLSEYRIIKYTLFMIIFGVIYYKYVYIKNKEKLLQSQLEAVKLIDIKGEFSKEILKTFIITVIGIIFLFCIILFGVIYINMLDMGGRLSIIVCYVICIPLSIIECELKGRFLLVKHLLKLNN